VLETVCDYSRVVNAGFLVEDLCGVVFAYHDGEVAGGIKKNLVSADSDD
jgi:hypothetical protein